jgi:alkylation response protein AidB-like acyl-CoA dehydrogenase
MAEFPDDPGDFRQTIRDFLADSLPPGWHGFGALTTAERVGFAAQWRARMHTRGLVAPTWPAEYGGAGLSAEQAIIVQQELGGAGAIVRDVQLEIGMLLGYTLLDVGTDEQKRIFLPRILSGEHRWCQGFSEPDAGSDLAGVRTRAVYEDGTGWVVNGQKIWTSEAQQANWIFVLCRTDSTAPRHAGLTLLLVPMDQPGIQVRPIRNINGSSDFSEVFFTDALTDSNLVVGAVNDGWRVVSLLLGYERSSTALIDAFLFRDEYDRLAAFARESGKLRDDRTRQEFAQAYTRVEVLRLVAARAAYRAARGETSSPADAAVNKIMWSEHHLALAELAMNVLGTSALIPQGDPPASFFMDLPGAPSRSLSWVWTWLSAHSDRIRGGTSEVLRNVIAERGLGLPREALSKAGAA